MLLLNTDRDERVRDRARRPHRPARDRAGRGARVRRGRRAPRDARAATAGSARRDAECCGELCLVAVVGVTVLVGCGGDDSAVDRKDVRSVLALSPPPRTPRTGRTMCSLISSRERAELEKAKPSGCAAYYSFLSSRYGTVTKTDFRVESLKVHGRTAVLGDSSGETTYFTNENGGWLVDRVAPVGTSEAATARHVQLLADARKPVKNVSCRKGSRLYRCDRCVQVGQVRGVGLRPLRDDRGRVWHSDVRRCS